LTHRFRKTVCISEFLAARILAVVIAERLLVHIAEQMEWFDGNVSSGKSALEQTPKVFDSISVNATSDIFLGVIYHVMNEAIFQAIIGNVGVSVDLRTKFDVLENLSLQSLAFHVRDDLSANLAHLAIHDAHDNRLAAISAHLLITQSAILVHVSDATANVGFVYFDFAAIASELPIPMAERVESLSDSLQHEPCRLLRDSERAVNLPRRDAVLAVHEHPDRRHPLIESKSRVLEDRANLDGELLLAGIAVPDSPGLNERVLIRTAPWADDFAVRPAHFDRIVERPI